MDLEYDPNREAAAAMKLAAETNGAERQRWITAALAWSELNSLRGAAGHSLPEGWPTRELVPAARRSASPTPLQAARIALGSRSGENAMSHPLTGSNPPW